MGCGDFCADGDRGHDHRPGHALFRQPGPGCHRRRANNDNGQPSALCDSHPGESIPKFLRKSFAESFTKSFTKSLTEPLHRSFPKFLRKSFAEPICKPCTDSHPVSRHSDCFALALGRLDA